MHLLTLTTRPGHLGGPGTDNFEVDVIDFTQAAATSAALLLGCPETGMSYTQIQAEISSPDFDVFIRIDAPTFYPRPNFGDQAWVYASELSTFPEGWKLRVGLWINTASGGVAIQAGQLATTSG